MKKQLSKDDKLGVKKNGFNYCRSCYKHLAGYVGVTISEAMEERGYLQKSDSIYLVPEKGWEWLSQFEISESDFNKNRSPLTRQCVDGTERRPHLAGQLGAALLDALLDKGWLKRVESTREIVITPKGSQSLNDSLGVAL